MFNAKNLLDLSPLNNWNVSKTQLNNVKAPIIKNKNNLLILYD